MKSYHLKLDVFLAIKPVAQRRKKMPFHMRAKVEEAIGKLLQAGITEKFEGAAPWVSPIMVVPKPNNEKVRLCIDMRQVNRAILRQ